MGILDKVKNLLSQNADKVETVINKAGEFVDEQTQGNYSDAIHKRHDAASNVVGMSDQQS
ncbi:antitoxin [Mycobacterium tuberculosis]|uniref:antitoxin n=1 Tax=Mycobacterium tuberculosis TaxID=1773 RepID=UPI000910E389|nr:antitoxin [Mycobacterium tuberculosis]SGM53539.1 antitoxin [Mycobacterium tuberculosis]